MKSRKLLSALASIIVGGAAFAGFALTGCGDNKNNNGDETPQHHWSEIYGKDENNHWLYCTDEGCDERSQEGPHDFSNGNCVCGKEKPTDQGDDDKDGVISLTAYDHTQNGSRITLRLQTLFKVGDTFNSTNLVVVAKSSVDGQEKTETLKLSDVQIVAPDMTTAGEKTVLIKFGGKETSYKINVIDLSGVSKNQASVTVNQSADIGANGNVVTVKSINDAVTVFKLLGTADNTEKVINIKKGKYIEKVEFDIPNLYVIGETSDAEETVIEYNLIAGYECPGANAKYSTDGSATVSVRAGAIGFHAKNITFQNYYNTHEKYLESTKIDKETMAVACLVQADRCVFENVRFSSYHDTLYDYNGRHVYKDCFIEGRTDYVFGYGATSLFENCTLNTIGAKDDRNGGYVCATKGFVNYVNNWQDANTVIDYGYIFSGCTFTADKDVVEGTASLARAWSHHMMLAFIECDISAAYSKTAYGSAISNKNTRYGSMSQGDPNPARLCEYGNTGAGALDYAALGSGVKENLCKVLTEAEKNALLDKSVIFAAVNGQYEYSSDWNGTVPVVAPTVINFEDLGPQISTPITVTEDTPLFDGAITVKGTYRPNGNSVLVEAGTVIKITVPAKITVNWYGGTYGTAANGKLVYKNGYAILTIVADGVSSQIYIKSIEIDTAHPGVHVHEYGEWDITEPTTETAGTAIRTCQDCELAVAHKETVILPVLSENDYKITASQTAGKSVYTLKSDESITFEADAPAGLHVHHYGEWTVTTTPTATTVGEVSRTCGDGDCNHDATATESKQLPKLDDSGYSITNNTATVNGAGTGTYTITIDGIDGPVSFEEATPQKAATQVFNFTTLTSKSSDNKYFNEEITMSGNYTVRSGDTVKTNVGTKIVMHDAGTVTIEWHQADGQYGNDNNAEITYSDGKATIEIVTGAGGAADGNIYIRKITIDRANVPQDTRYTVTFDSKGGSPVAAAEVLPGGKVEKPEDPARGGHTFDGWYKDEAFATAFDFDTATITEDITLYAKWTNDTVQTYSVAVKAWGKTELTVDVTAGDALTEDEVNTRFRLKDGYADYSVKLFTDENLTEPFDGTVSGDMTVYAGVISDKAVTYTYAKGVDGNSAYLNFANCSFTNDSWLTYGGSGSAIKFYVTAGTVIKFGRSPYETGTTVKVNNEEMPAGNSSDIVEVSYTATADGFVSITANGTAYLKTITVTPAIKFKAGDSVTLIGSKINLTAGQNTEYAGLSITAGTDKFQDQSSQPYLHAGAGAVITFKVADGINADNTQIIFVDHNGNEGSYNSSNFTFEVENGIATITVGSGTMYIKSFRLAAK